MLRLALTFLVVAIVAALLGLGCVDPRAGTVAKFLFPVFLVLFVLSLLRATLRHS
ncbi:MAG: DUF1328 domain-containing protein [Flavobacteriales bacterium]